MLRADGAGLPSPLTLAGGLGVKGGAQEARSLTVIPSRLRCPLRQWLATGQDMANDVVRTVLEIRKQFQV